MTYILHDSRRVGSAAELIAAYRFTEAHRIPSWPLVPLAYDFILDCGDSLQRVQVKSAQFREGSTWSVRLTKRNQKKDLPIVAACIDYVCVVCNPGRIYVLPTAVIRSAARPDCLVPRLVIYENNERFAPFLNNFALGSGLGVGDAAKPAEVRERWASATRKENVGYIRKRHERLTIETIIEIRRQLGNNSTPQARREVCLQYGITAPTLRNYLLGKRKDLEPV